MRNFYSKMILLGLLAPVWLRAQVPPQVPAGGLVQLQVAQPPVDTSSPVTATATFDPPVVRPGEKTFYRVTMDATEVSIRWPGEIPAASELQLGPDARGQITQLQGNQFRPVTTFAYEVRATTAGRFSISNFVVVAYGQSVEVPAASLEVIPADSSPLPPARQLMLETSATNIYLGQPIRVRVQLPAAQGNEIEALREVQFNGDGLMTDKTAMRQTVETINNNGRLKPTFVYETTVTPIAVGSLKFSAQAFTAGREFSGPISISGQVTLSGGPAKYLLLTSEPAELNVRPLPSDGELPGFTGALGKFIADPPQLSTNRIHIGEPVRLKVGFHGEGSLTRFVPPEPPRSREWQIIADPALGMGFTLIPQTDEVQATPEIPFSAFDPVAGKYVNLTIPSLPVMVTGESLPTELRAPDDVEKKLAPLKLSGLASTPGKSVTSLKPLQLQGWFVMVQLLPVMGFMALWQWDRRRRFLEAHPEIVRRRQARQALRREKSKLRKAVANGDATAFVRHAVEAMQVACAPHFPAHPQALVCGDVLSQLDEPARSSGAGEAVRKLFATADSQFAGTPAATADLPALRDGVETVLQQLEGKL